MRQWPRRIRGAVLMGLTWALVWGVAAVLMGMIVDPDGSMDEMWVAVGAYPGFLGGVAYSAVLAIADRRRGIDELSLSRVGAWGAVTGLLLGALPFALGSPTSALPPWLLGAVVVVPATVLGAASACASLAVARLAGGRDALGAGADPAGVGPAGGEGREPPGGSG